MTTQSNLTYRDLAKMIDHSLLHPTMTDQQIVDGCRVARAYDVATACVEPYAVAMAREFLQGSDVGVYPVIVRLCEICTSVGVAFVKTSTGYGFVKQPDGSYN
jgi:deoxyribose-phosphate aldolase